MIRLLFFGDVYSKAGRIALLNSLPGLKEEFRPDFVIANGENLADGKGLTEKTAKPLFHAGVDALTGGNHLWDRKEAWEYIRNQPQIVKPLNYPEATPGFSSCALAKDDKQLTIVTLCGQIYMPPCDSPFTALETWLNRNQASAGCLMIDFHAESTSEKRAMGWFVDGRAAALVGTHTHIQTADEELLPRGTAYITDVGMTGAHDSVIGVKKEIILDKFVSALPARYESADRGLQINAVYLELDGQSGRAISIQRIKREVQSTPEALESQ